MRLALLSAAFFLCVNIASAQTFGSITGEVHDPSGAVTPNTQVTATNIATNVARSTSTNESGVYTFPDLIPATYQIRVTAPGFQTATSTVEI